MMFILKPNDLNTIKSMTMKSGTSANVFISSSKQSIKLFFNPTFRRQQLLLDQCKKHNL